MHTCRADIHAHGLQDDCERCAEHAEKPFGNLDDTALRDLIDRTLRNRFGSDQLDAARAFGERVHPRSDTEARAMAVVMTALEQFGKAAESAGDMVAVYLRERWRLEAFLHNPRAEQIEALRQRLTA